jgi:predicted nuclease with TOPRIM domain
MNINFKKLNNVLIEKTNKAINKLNELKCTTEEYKNVLNSIINNVEVFNKLKNFDTECEECKNKIENEEVRLEMPQPNSPIGKKWIEFKE